MSSTTANKQAKRMLAATQQKNSDGFEEVLKEQMRRQHDAAVAEEASKEQMHRQLDAAVDELVQGKKKDQITTVSTMSSTKGIKQDKRMLSANQEKSFKEALEKPKLCNVEATVAESEQDNISNSNLEFCVVERPEELTVIDEATDDEPRTPVQTQTVEIATPAAPIKAPKSSVQDQAIVCLDAFTQLSEATVAAVPDTLSRLPPQACKAAVVQPPPAYKPAVQAPPPAYKSAVQAPPPPPAYRPTVVAAVPVAPVPAGQVRSDREDQIRALVDIALLVPDTAKDLLKAAKTILEATTTSTPTPTPTPTPTQTLAPTPIPTPTLAPPAICTTALAPAQVPVPASKQPRTTRCDLCAFGATCNKPECLFVHPNQQCCHGHRIANNEVCPHYQAKHQPVQVPASKQPRTTRCDLCAFGDRCNKPECLFVHPNQQCCHGVRIANNEVCPHHQAKHQPIVAAQPVPASKQPRTTRCDLCRFGAQCNKPECLFVHPNQQCCHGHLIANDEVCPIHQQKLEQAANHPPVLGEAQVCYRCIHGNECRNPKSCKFWHEGQLCRHGVNCSYRP